MGKHNVRHNPNSNLPWEVREGDEPVTRFGSQEDAKAFAKHEDEQQAQGR